MCLSLLSLSLVGIGEHYLVVEQQLHMLFWVLADCWRDLDHKL